MKKLHLIPFLLLLFTSASSQIVNIEARRMHTDSIRFVTDVNFAVLLNSTNGKTLATLRGNIVSQWKSSNYKHLVLAAVNYDFAQAEKDDYVNNFYLHFRYNYKINNWLRWEAFTQTQTNEPLGIYFRQLLGTGPRFKIRLGKDADIYMGSTYMWEYEKTTDRSQLLRGVGRWSNYTSLNIHIPKLNGSLISTFYYQPLFSNFQDYRLMNDTRLDLNITTKWRVYTKFSYLYDSKPPLGIRKNALNLEQGFGFSIK